MTSGPASGGVWDPIIEHTSFFPVALVAVVGAAIEIGMTNALDIAVGTF